MHKIAPNEIVSVLRTFPPLICWKLGLAYGSTIYFELIDEILERTSKGGTRQVGWASLWIYGDVWSIWRGNVLIIDSTIIDRDRVENTLSPQIIGEQLENIQICEDSCQANLAFSDGYHLKISSLPSSEGDLLALDLPDGRILKITARLNAVFSEEIDLNRQQKWRDFRRGNLSK